MMAAFLILFISVMMIVKSTRASLRGSGRFDQAMTMDPIRDVFEIPFVIVLQGIDEATAIALETREQHQQATTRVVRDFCAIVQEQVSGPIYVLTVI
jgi:hypothetical protein